LVSLGVDGKTVVNGTTGVHGRGGAVSVAVVASIVNLDAGGGVARVVVDGVLHLTEHGVDLDEILLRACVGQRQIVLLGERVVMARSRRSVHYAWARMLRHVLGFSAAHGTIGNREGTVKGEQRSANLGVGGRVNLPALGAAEKVINHVEGALTVVATSGTVSQMLGTRSVHGRLVEVEAVVGRRLRSIVASWVTSLVREGGAGAHLTIVVIIAGRAFGLRAVVHTTRILARRHENGVIGMSLDMLLEILRSLERLATELALVRLERNVNTDVRGDVIALYGGSATRIPLAGEVQVVCTLAANMAFTDMLVESFWCWELLVAVAPAAGQWLLSGR
jgi:hypothetical protein